MASLWSAFDQIPTLGSEAGTARLLVGNVEAWNARWALLGDATRTLDAVYFLLERDAFGFAFLGYLLKKQKSGVAVRLMIDAMADPSGRKGFKAHLGQGKDSLQELVQHGARVGIYHPSWQRLFKPFSLSVLASNHDKVLVADGAHSITGGRNISRDYFVDPRDMPGAWRDTDTELAGEGAAGALTAAFEAEFRKSSVVATVRRDVRNHVRRDLELIGAYCLMDIVLEGGPLGEDEKNRRRADAVHREEVARDLVDRVRDRLPSEGIDRAASRQELGHLAVLALELAGYPELWGSARGWREARDGVVPCHDCCVKIIDQTARSGGRVNRFAATLVGLVNGAQSNVMIENPYVVLTEEMLATLEAAARRGVQVWIGTNSWISTDSPVTQGFFLEDWMYILARVPTARIFVTTGQARLHAKVATFDDEVTLVSTYNMDFLSGFVNGEVGAVVWSREFTRSARDAFMADFGLGGAAGDQRADVEEYRIRWDPDGLPRLTDGRLTPERGPEHHLGPHVQRQYLPWRRLCNLLRLLPWLWDLRRPPLVRPAQQQ